MKGLCVGMMFVLLCLVAIMGFQVEQQRQELREYNRTVSELSADLDRLLLDSKTQHETLVELGEGLLARNIGEPWPIPAHLTPFHGYGTVTLDLDSKILLGRRPRTPADDDIQYYTGETTDRYELGE